MNFRNQTETNVLRLHEHPAFPDLPAERWNRCCDDERELLLAAARRALAEERAARGRRRMRVARRLIARRLGWPYPPRPRRLARLIGAAVR